MKKYNRQNVYDALFEIYELTQKPTELAISKIFRKHNLSGTIGTIIVKNGILKVVKGKRPKSYLWNSTKPHFKMVDKVIEKTQELSKFYRENPIKQKQVVEQPIEEENNSQEPTHRTLKVSEFEICDNGTKEKLKQLEEINENSIYKIGELHDIVDTYKNMLKNLNAERQHNVDKILDQNKKIQELTNYQNETLYTTKELKNEVIKWCTAYNEMQHKLERQVKIANDLHQQVAVFNKKQKDRSIKNFTVLWGMIKINY